MQTDFADSFVKSMLGWMRSLFRSVVSLFTDASSTQSAGGSTLLQWFRSGWLAMVIFLILLGLAIDWLIWIIRWKPYWLWFHKKRIVLEDDIDLDLDDEQLRRRYGGKTGRSQKMEPVLPDVEEEEELFMPPRKQEETAAKVWETPAENIQWGFSADDPNNDDEDDDDEDVEFMWVKERDPKADDDLFNITEDDLPDEEEPDKNA